MAQSPRGGHVPTAEEMKAAGSPEAAFELVAQGLSRTHQALVECGMELAREMSQLKQENKALKVEIEELKELSVEIAAGTANACMEERAHPVVPTAAADTPSSGSMRPVCAPRDQWRDSWTKLSSVAKEACQIPGMVLDALEGKASGDGIMSSDGASREATNAMSNNPYTNAAEARRSGSKRRTTIMAVQKAVAASSNLDKKERNKQKNHLMRVMRLQSHPHMISIEKLYEALHKRNEQSGIVGTDFTQAWLKGVMAELKDIASRVLETEHVEAWDPESCVPFDDLVDLISVPNLADFAREPWQQDVRDLHKLLLARNLDDVIREAHDGQAAKNPYQEILMFKPQTVEGKYEGTVSAVAGLCVVISIALMGISMDYYPDNPVWNIIEGLCTAVFLFEVYYMVKIYGCKKFIWTGDAIYWHWLDVVIVSLSCCDLVLSIIVHSGVVGTGITAWSSTAARLSVALRALRIARVIRLMKLLRSPLFRDLANMLSGFVLGVPSLIWVFVFLMAIVYLTAIIFRIMLGPAGDQDMISLCGGSADVEEMHDAIWNATSMRFEVPPERMQTEHYDFCWDNLHWIYGEEYFATVTGSVLTTFRCMIGDCTDRKGQPLAVMLNAGYGLRFTGIYMMCMIAAIFGVFNIITAIFVDSTIAGLKNTNSKRKYARQYGEQFVKQRLKALMIRVDVLCKAFTSLQSSKIQDMSTTSADLWMQQESEEIYLTYEQFLIVMEDPEVHRILQDLDVEMYHPAMFFDTFDPTGTGRISMAAFATAVLKLRGEPQKNDMIASLVSLKMLHEKVGEIEALLVKKVASEADAEAAGTPMDDTMITERLTPPNNLEGLPPG